MHPGRLSHTAVRAAMALAPFIPVAAQACSSEPYLGDVCMVALRFCPQGYMPADGRLLPVGPNQALYALIGNTFGGTIGVDFALPDLRGRAVVGSGTGSGFQGLAAGQPVGQQTVTLNPGQLPVPAHTHGATFVPASGKVDVTVPAVAGNLAVDMALPVGGTVDNAFPSPPSDTVHLTAMGVTTGTATGPYTPVAPSDQASSTLQATVTASGSAPRAAAKVSTGIATGGTVAVAVSDGKAPSASIRMQAPALGVTTCIATSDGSIPTRQ